MNVTGPLLLPYRLARYAVRAWRDARPAARRHNISTWRIMREQIALKRLTELRPDEYYLFGLDDPNIPWEDKLSYISDAGRRMWYIMTPPKYHGIYRNKLLFKRFFQNLGLPTAEHYGIYDPEWGETVSGEPLRTADDIAAWMAATNVREPVFKPTESAEGKMIYVMTGRAADDEAAFQSIDGETYTPQRLVQTLGDPQLLANAYPDEPIQQTFLVEARLQSHPKVTEITTSQTLCCTRLVTLITDSGEIKICGTYFKITPQDMGADNVAEDSRTLFVYVDPETGVLGEGRFYYLHDPTPYRTHPDTGVPFYGVQLPDFAEALALVRKAAMAVPMARTIGWDVAFTTDGPVLVEGNAAWGVRSVQYASQKGLNRGDFKDVYNSQLRQGYASIVKY
jgi:Sugar-transfer associated ATP-grasp